MSEFDKWFESMGYAEERREDMRIGFEAARALYAPEGSKLMSADAGWTLQDALRWEQTKRVREAWPPAVNDMWIVKVRGGQIESAVIVTSVSPTEIWVTDPPLMKRGNNLIRTNPRKHLIENLEFLKLLDRGSK